MKQLWIVRHAKSSWDDFSIADHDRPLNKRGKRDAPFMANVIKENYPVPEILVSSTAKRARSTGRVFRSTFGLSKKEWVKKEELYHASIQACLQAIHGIDESHNTAAIFGHNPTFTYLIHELTGKGPDNLPTCGCALITSAAEYWSTFEVENCELTHLLFPKQFNLD